MEFAANLERSPRHPAHQRGHGRAVSHDCPTDTLDQRKFGVFHVPVATNSPFIPAQNDFVAPYGVASVLGFGGMLPDGDLFVVIIFARVPIPASTAEMFRTIALNLKLGLLASLDKPVFAD
jgi:hypothetical protein